MLRESQKGIISSLIIDWVNIFCDISLQLNCIWKSLH